MTLSYVAGVPTLSLATVEADYACFSSNVPVVNYATGAFVQLNSNTWVENNTSGSYLLVETGRDSQSIYLENSNGESIVLNLSGNQISGPHAEDSSATLSAILETAPNSTFAVSRVTYSSGAFIQLNDEDWVENNSDGSFFYKEERRDEESIYLDDVNRDVSIRLDLNLNTVFYADPSQTLAIYTISSVDPNTVSGFSLREYFTRSSVFTQHTPLTWLEIKEGGSEIVYTEIQRDDSSVTIYNELLNTYILLDNDTKQALFRVGGAPYEPYLGEEQSSATTPSVPTFIAATDGVPDQSYVAVSWNAVDGAESYTLVRCLENNSADCDLVASDITTTSFDDSEGVARDIYFYRVQACNSAGCSGLSVSTTGYRAASSSEIKSDLIPISIGFKDDVVPGVGLDDGVIQVVTKNFGEPDSDHFDWQFLVDGLIVESGRTTAAELSSDTSLESRQIFTIEVSYFFGDEDTHRFGIVVDSSAEIDETNEDNNTREVLLAGLSGVGSAPTGPEDGGGVILSDRLEKPEAPAAPSADDGISEDQITVSWELVRDADYYAVYICDSESSDSCLLHTEHIFASSHTIAAGTEVGTTYYFRVSACNASGCSGLSSADAGFRLLFIPSEPSRLRKLNNAIVGATAEEFSEMDSAFPAGQWRVKDLDIKVVDGEFLHTAVWEEGSGGWYATDSLADFKNENSLYRINKGMYLVDIEWVPYEGGYIYAGVWHPRENFNGTTYTFFQEIDEFEFSVRTEGTYLVDVDVQFFNGRYWYSGLFYIGENPDIEVNAEWQSSGDRSYFIQLLADYAARGWTLMDLDIRDTGGSILYVGLWHEFRDLNATLVQPSIVDSANGESNFEQIIAWEADFEEGTYELHDMEVIYSDSGDSYTLIARPDYGYDHRGIAVAAEPLHNSYNLQPIVPQLESMESWEDYTLAAYDGPYSKYGNVSGHIQGVASC